MIGQPVDLGQRGREVFAALVQGEKAFVGFEAVRVQFQNLAAAFDRAGGIASAW
jgi:hypothetical protein